MDGDCKRERKPASRMECLRLSIRLYPSIEDDAKIINHLKGLCHRQNGGISSVIKAILLSHFTGFKNVVEPLSNKKSLEKAAQDVTMFLDSQDNGDNMAGKSYVDDFESGAMALMKMKF